MATCCRPFASKSHISDWVPFNDGASSEISEPSEQECAAQFPIGRQINLLGHESLFDIFYELPDRGSPNGGWVYLDGALRSKSGRLFSHLVTRCRFKNFALDFDWIISTAGNSGLKYLVNPKLGPVGLEYQILDDERHPDGQTGGKHQTGALYDLYEPVASKTLYPPGVINQSKIICRDGAVEHWLNNQKVLSFEPLSLDFAERLKRSKFKNIMGFAQGSVGHLLIQHHGDEVIFKKIQVSALP